MTSEDALSSDNATAGLKPFPGHSSEAIGNVGIASKRRYRGHFSEGEDANRDGVEKDAGRYAVWKTAGADRDAERNEINRDDPAGAVLRFGGYRGR